MGALARRVLFSVSRNYLHFFVMFKLKSLLFVLTFFLSLSSAFAQDARVWYVSADGLSSASARSWNQATNFHRALRGAEKGDSLFLKAGSYSPNRAGGNLVTDPRDATFEIPDGLLVYGGFEGTEATLSARDMTRIATTNETIIEGNIGDSESNGDNIKDLFTVHGGDTATLDGLTVARGNTPGDGAALYGGRESQVTIRHSRFIDNRATDGGAIFIDDGGTLIIASSHFESNTSTSTSARTGGGAIFVDDDGTLMITGSTFESNTSFATGTNAGGAAIRMSEDGTLRVADCAFEGNSSRTHGGAIYANEGVMATITTSTFEENTSNGSGSAVALRVVGASTVSHCSFLRNRTMGTGNGTLWSFGGGPTHVSNNLFVANHANTGAALFHDNVGSGGSFVNNTVYGNTDRDHAGSVGTVSVNASWVFANNVIYGNESANELFVLPAGTTLAHNLVEGNDIALHGDGTPTRTSPVTAPSSVSLLFDSTDPMHAGYLRLLPGSVGVDAGGNNYIDGDADAFEEADATTDLAGNPRIVNTTIDLGAYEVPASARSLRVVDTERGGLFPSMPVPVPLGGGVLRLQLLYAGSGTTGVSIAEGSDPNDLLSLGATSVSSSPGEVMLTVAANTTMTQKEATLTFSLSDATPALTQSIRFVQRGRMPATLYVAVDGVGHADGLSWDNATTFQAALDNAASGDMIFVKAGTYTPTAKKADGMAATEPRDATYVLPDGVSIYGGFDGTEASLSARDMTLIATTNETLIEGNIGDMDDNEDNIKRLFVLGDDGEATLDGLTVARANAGTEGTEADGSGLRAGLRSETTLRHCRFIGNKSRNGGAIHINDNGMLTIINSTFEENQANVGGVIYARENTTITITNTAFRDNSLFSGGEGLAIYFHNNATGRIVSSTFLRNTGEVNASGTLYASTGVTLHISHSLFAENSAEDGSVLYSLGSGGSFVNNTLYGNQDRTTTLGTMTLEDGEANWVIANNVFYGNTTNEGQYELYMNNAANKTLAHNLIEGNDIKNPPAMRTGPITAPSSALLVFASLDPMAEDYLRLTLGAVGVDAGNNNYIDGNVDAFEMADTMNVRDAAGNARLANNVVDVGAYEMPLTDDSQLHVVGADGVLLSTTAVHVLPPAGGMFTFRVAYRGLEASGVTITEMSDPDGLFPPQTAPLSSSPAEVSLTFSANTTTAAKQAVLTFTLGGVEVPIVQNFSFIQHVEGTGTTRHVATDGDADADGLTWATPTTLQSALDNYVDGDTLFVKKGTYTPTAKKADGMPATDAREATYVLPDGIIIYGGFAGTEGDHSSRVMTLIATTNETIIEGNIGDMASNGDNVKDLLSVHADDTATLDGLTVARGNSTGDGAGLYATGQSQVTIRHCRFIENRATNGGAIFINNGGTLIIENSHFESNTSAGFGGAVFVHDGGTLRVSSSNFQSNSATGNGAGGAICVNDDATLTISSSTFERNTSARQGAAVYIDDDGTIRVSSSTFERNRSGRGGAGISVGQNTEATITTSVFEENTSERSGAAVALVFSGTSTISHCSFIGNNITGSFITFGTVHANGNFRLDVSNNVFANNRTKRAAALNAEGGSSGTFINNTVYGNRDEHASSTSTVRLRGASTTWVVANNIIYGNTAGHQVHFQGATNKTMVHNLIQGNSIQSSPTRIGMITAPASAADLFESTEATNAGYLRLLPGSAFVNAGNNNYIDGNADDFEATDATTDLAGNPRIANTTIDLGAYEVPASTQFLRIVDANGMRFGASDVVTLPAAGATEVRFRVLYSATGATGVSVSEASDDDEVLSLTTSSIGSSGAEVVFNVAANTTISPREVTLTFTLTSATPAFAPSIRFVQKRRAGVLHVATDGGAEADGLTWATATTLQSALDRAVEGDTLFVKRGVYTPTAKKADGMPATDPRDATYVLPNEIKIYGGFVGTEANLEARVMTLIATTNETIIEGNIGDMDDNTDNVKRLFELKEGYEATLDGLTVARGYFGTDGDGSALYAGEESELTLRHCRFIECKARDGGAIFVANEGELTITSSVFDDNEANFGAAIYMRESTTFNATGSVFEDNTLAGGGEGLAVFLRNNSMGRIVRCSFLRNRGQRGSSGTLFAAAGVTLHISQSLFVANSAEDGSTLWAGGSGGTFINNTVYGNKDRTSTHGTITLEDGTATWVIANNILFGNAIANEGQHELAIANATNKTLAHNLIRRKDIINAPSSRIGPVKSPYASLSLFASTDPTDPNYLRLLPGSAGVDAGNNDYIDGDADDFEATDATIDLAGGTRIVNTTVDLGAYEAPLSTANYMIIDIRSETSIRTSLNAILVESEEVADTLRVRFGGPDAMNVAIAETSDPGNMLTSVASPVSSSPNELFLFVAANTTAAVKEAVLTFTLGGVTPPLVQVIRFIQKRGANGIVHVATDGDANANGSSWATATTLQSALDNYVDEDTLFVKKGTYTPTAKRADGSLAVDPRDATYVLPDEITIYGGFAGTEANLEARRMNLIATTNETIIEGNIGDIATHHDNIKDLLTVPDEAILDGLTVARGNSPGDGAGLYGGGESEVTIRHCRFIENRANNGGAIYIDDDGTLTIASSHFESNTAFNDGANTGGGAIFVDDDGTLMLSSSTFERNTTNGSGGGAIHVDDGTITITTSTFEENTSALEGSVAALDFATEGTISHCSFLRNRVSTRGTLLLGGDGPVHVSNNLFVANSAHEASVFSETSSNGGSFINNTVYANTDRDALGGRILVRSTGPWVIANNVFYGNEGGAELRIDNFSDKTLAHNLIEGNRIRVGTGTPTRTGGIASPALGLEMFASLDPTDAGYLRPLGASVLADGGNNDYIDGNADAFETADAMGLKDLAGGARIVNTTIDVGAYEALLPSAASLRVLDEASGALLGATGNALLPSGGGRYALRVAYTGADAMGVSITGASDFATLSATSTTTPSARINLDIAENMTTSSRSVELTFTLNGVTPVQTQVVRLVQKRRAARIFVTEEGMSSANGLSWATATTLNKALSMSASEGDTVYVKAGSYTPTDSAGVQAVDPRNGRYVLLDGMKVYGGFLGTETSLEDRNEVLLATINETIIEGNRGEAMSSTDNVRSLFNLGEDERARLDGFTIARANGEASSAIELGVFSRLTLSSCRLIGNRNTSGGGALRSARNASLGIEGSLFEENSSSGRGAAIYADEWTSVSVTGTRFEENTLNEGDEGLAIYFARNGRGRVVRSVFLRNTWASRIFGHVIFFCGCFVACFKQSLCG